MNLLQNCFELRVKWISHFEFLVAKLQNDCCVVFSCVQPGYIDDPDSIGEFGAENCLDVDECADESDDCEVSRPDSTCVNYPGAYYCECNEGFVLNEATGKCDGTN